LAELNPGYQLDRRLGGSKVVLDVTGDVKKVYPQQKGQHILAEYHK
jgi:hypothetical protein